MIFLESPQEILISQQLLLSQGIYLLLKKSMQLLSVSFYEAALCSFTAIPITLLVNYLSYDAILFLPVCLYLAQDMST